MFILDDFLLGAVVICFIMITYALSSGFLCIVSGLLIAAGGSENIIEGGAGKKKKDKSQRDKSQRDKSQRDKSQRDKSQRDDIPLKTFKNFEQTFDIVAQQIKKYGYKEPNPKDLRLQMDLIEIAKNIYKKEKGPLSLFDFDYKKILGAYSSGDYVGLSDDEDKNMTKQAIKKLMYKRVLDEDYPITTATAYAGWNMSHIEYSPKNKSEYDKLIKKVFEYAVISSVRSLSDKESADLNEIINQFSSGELTHPKMSLHFYDKDPQEINNCKTYQINRPYSNKYKKLHWGQRKLLLSEIDFFNRVALEIGPDKFKESQIALVYPGAAHGHHLLIEMEMYPSLVLYLWDPSYYNEVLYLADFLRRKMTIPFNYNEKHMEIAKKYASRVYINMELPNDIYLIYWTNATTDKSKNYGPEYGFFTKKSADYYLQHIKKQKTKSFTLFVSDIRLYTNEDALNMLTRNNIAPYNSSVALLMVSEKQRKEDYDRDMKLQRDWIDFVKADYGLFKFKMKTKKWIEKQPTQYEYPNGEIIIQAWGPITTTETRLFVTPDRNPAYYNIQKYTDMMKTVNLIMRPHDMRGVTLKELDINVVDDSDTTMEDVWSPVLYDTNLIGQDAILETYILYDYLTIYKDKRKIKWTDLTLMISDITMSCLNPFDQEGILGYFNDSNVEDILSVRHSYHKQFANRLDYNSPLADKNICKIERKDDKKNKWQPTQKNKWQRQDWKHR